MNAELLRDAAALMRERAEAATPGRWESWQNRDAEAVIVEAGRGHFGTVARPNYGKADYGLADAEHIASWHPAVAYAVADWLDWIVDLKEKANLGWDMPEDHPALALARVYLGRPS